jgi:hypothetical protein
VQKFETRRQVINALELELCSARGKINDLAVDRLRIRTEQKPPCPRDQPLRRVPEPTSFIRSAHAQLCDKNPVNVYNPLITDLLRGRRQYHADMAGHFRRKKFQGMPEGWPS